jgi:t-SNARE complex subunit (syntaxin)
MQINIKGESDFMQNVIE